MSIIIGSARINEKGTTTGGEYGDQTGSEVSTQSFYMHEKGWYGLRFKSVTFANAMATAMKEACDNNNIGYCQTHRGTLLTEFKKTKSIKAITTKCEADCSSLIRVCIYQACGTLVSDFTTSDEKSVLLATGLFEEFTVSSSSSVYNGDILVTKTKGHTVAVVSGRARQSTSSTGTTSDGTLDVDGCCGSATTTRWQKVMGSTGNNVDGKIDGQDSKQKKYWTSISSSVCKWSGGSSIVVKATQKKVISAGYSCGSTGADGELGKNTAKAMQKWLIALGYSCGSKGADGYFGTNSMMAFQRWLNDQKI